MTSFHSRTLELIRTPVPTLDGEGLSAAEARLGVEIPASVVEWYSNFDGQSLLSEFSNDDQSLPPEEWRLETIDGRRIVVFLVENQGVCWWGFELDVGDDPSVFVNMDPPPDNLFVYAGTFSEFTYVRVFDHNGYWDPDRCSLETFQPLEAGDLDLLRKRFREEPGSHGWPGTDTYRFSSNLGRITIWQSDCQSDWTILANSSDALRELEQSVSDLRRNDS